MSLPDFKNQADLFGLQGLQRDKLFTNKDRYRLFYERIYPILVKARERLKVLYCEENGRPAIEPVTVLGVSLLQVMERQPDRQAIEQLKYHMGWKYALGQELDEAVFDATVLVRFRQGLVKHGQERLIFEEILEALEQAGLLSKRAGKQRLDSTHVLGLVARMSALDCIREALRISLEEIAGWGCARPGFWDVLWERYVEHELNYKSGTDILEAKRVQAGEDAAVLLSWLAREKREGPKVDVLKRVFKEYYTVEEGQVVPEKTILAKSVQNPHDPDASYRAKQDKKWVGYGVQVAETVPEEPGTTGFITAMATQTAVGSDEAGMEQVLAEQNAMGFEKPSELYVDGAYVSAEVLAEADEEGREIVGPVAQARKPKEGKSIEEFTIDIPNGRAVCPAGEAHTQLSRIEDRTNGILEYRYEWSWKCKNCALRSVCLPTGQKHRTIRVNSNFMHLQARRVLMKTEAFQEKMNKRAGIEATISEIVRAYAARRARYRGLTKVRLQNYFIGAACNVNRWLRRLISQLFDSFGTLPPLLAYAP